MEISDKNPKIEKPQVKVGLEEWHSELSRLDPDSDYSGRKDTGSKYLPDATTLLSQLDGSRQIRQINDEDSEIVESHPQLRINKAFKLFDKSDPYLSK